MARNPLAPVAIVPDDPNPMLAGVPTQADAMDYNSGAVRDWLAAQQAQSAQMGLWANGAPTQAGMVDAGRQIAGALVAGTAAPRGGIKLPVRPSSEDVNGVLSANFQYGRNVGPKTVDIDTLNGGVALDNPAQRARIDALKSAMTGEGGYISRPIVDTTGNVVEGQHRLEALRELGVKKVPVHVIQDLSEGVDVDGLHGAMQQAQPMHGDQRTQMTQHVLDALSQEGSPAAVSAAYDPPPGYARAWNAALDFLSKRSK